MIQYIQKAHIRYPKCQGGELHQGEALNLVCADETCEHRGIICPVCKIQSHEGHHIVPLKIFLGEIRDSVSNDCNPSELNNLAVYLQTLQLAKKELQDLLRQQILEISLIFKDIEIKLQSAYLSIRRNVLIQSSISSKLPVLLENLVSGINCDPFTLQRQFSQYCELLKFKEGKSKVTDKAGPLVEKFRALPHKIKSMMSTCLNQYRSKILEAGKKLDVSLEANETTSEQHWSGFTFSLKNKNQNVVLSENKDEAWLQEGQLVGFVFLQQTFTPSRNKVTLDIVRLSEHKMMLEVGKNLLLKEYPLPKDEVKKQLELYLHADGLDKIDAQGEQSGMQEGFFCFNQGDQVTIAVDFNTSRCRFSTTHIGEPYWLNFKSKIKQESSLRLCVGLERQDRVKIARYK